MMTTFIAKVSWEGVGAVATAIAALITAALAWFTRKSLLQNEKQHRDNLRPILVLVPPGGVEPADRSTLLEFKTDAGMHRLSLTCQLQNIGTGPALNPRMHLRAMGIEGYGFTKCFAPIRAGEALWELGDGSAVRFDAPPSDRYNSTDHVLAGGTLWELVLEYEDVFGRPFHTIHSKNATLPWTICGTGRAISRRTTSES